VKTMREDPMDHREATIRAIWNFEGFPESYDQLVNASQRPAASDVVLQLAEQACLSPDSLVLDAACYDASTSLPLLERFGCQLVGVDVSRHGFEARRRRGLDPRWEHRLANVQGTLENLPLASASCDLVWCRDAISCADGPAVIREVARVAKPGALVLLHTSCSTPLLEPKEREALFWTLGLHPESMDSDAIERAAIGAGLIVSERIRAGSQWLQYRLEANPTASDLVTLARLMQWPERYVAAWGETWYRRILAWHQWPIYQALGKLEGWIWVFENSG